MKNYKNTSGKAGVSEYEIGPDWIKIKFGSSDKIYVYTYALPGKKHVEEMKALALNGRGLTTYLNEHIRDKYDYWE